MEISVEAAIGSYDQCTDSGSNDALPITRVAADMDAVGIPGVIQARAPRFARHTFSLI